MSPHVSPQHREHIRSVLLEAMAKGEDEYALATRRAMLVEELQLPMPVVAAISARLTIHANRVLKEHDIGTLLRPSDLMFCVEYLRTISAGDHESACVDLAGHFGVPPQKLDGALTRLSELAEIAAERASQRKPAADLGEPTSSQTARLRKREGTGAAHVNYDFEAKVQWRLTWVRYLARTFTKAELSQAKVLCLPSPYVEREIQHYLALGIRPENTFAVEGGDRAAKRIFLLNARKAGINSFCGTLEQFLEQNPEKRFSIVNLDFPGQSCRRYIDIIARLPLVDKAAVLINFMAKRESGDMQAGLKDWADLSAPHAFLHRGQRLLEELRVPGGADADTIMERIRAAERAARSDTEFKSVRDEFSDSALLTGVSMYVSSNYGHYRDWIHEHLKYQTAHELVWRLTSLGSILGGLFSEQAAQCGFGQSKINFWAHMRFLFFGQPHAADAERHGYLSEASHSRSPFLSAFQMYHANETLRRDLKHTGRFLRDVSGHFLSEIKTGCPAAMIGLEIEQATPGTPRRSDMVRVRVGENIVASIEIGKLINDTFALETWVKSIGGLRDLIAANPERTWINP